MYNIGMDEVGSALLMTLALVGVSFLLLAVVGWGLYKAFKNKEDR